MGKGQKLPTPHDHCHTGVSLRQISLFSTARKVRRQGWNPLDYPSRIVSREHIVHFDTSPNLIASPQWQGVTQGDFNVGLPSINLKSHTGVDIPSTLPLLLQWGRYCCRVGISGTKHPSKLSLWITWRQQRNKEVKYRYFTLISGQRPGRVGFIGILRWNIFQC